MMMGACLSEWVRLQRFLAWSTEDLKARRAEFDDDGSMFIRVGASSDVFSVADRGSKGS